MRRGIVSSLVLVLLLAVACSTPDDVGEPPPEGTPVEEVPPDPTPDDADSAGDTDNGEADTAGNGPEETEDAAGAGIYADAIRAFDFANALWQDERNLSEVPLADATFTGEYGQVWTYIEETVYADVDGDGYEDALAALIQEDGQGVVTQWFLWRWDPDAAGDDGSTGSAVQVLDPVAVAARCGSEVHEVAAGDQMFTVTESVRMDGDDLSCADSPERERTRSVALQDGLLVQVEPERGYGGVCGTRVHASVAAVPSSWQVRVAPAEDAPLVTETAAIQDAVLYLSGESPMRPDGWVMVGVDTGAGDEPAHWPCGFIIGEHSG